MTRNENIINIINIIAAKKADLRRILEIERESFTMPWTRESLLSEINREDAFFAVAVCEESAPKNTDYKSPAADMSQRDPLGCLASGALGYVILRRAGDEGELLRIAVSNDARRRGIADSLMGAALDFAKENALASVFLEVRESNKAAVSLYIKWGFKPIHLRKGYYSNPTEDAVIMQYSARPS